jgi:hypothetical protein
MARKRCFRFACPSSSPGARRSAGSALARPFRTLDFFPCDADGSLRPAEIRAMSAIAAARSHFRNERVIEPIFMIMALPLRQTFPSNLRPEAPSQSVEPDAFLLQGFHQICRRDT